MLCPKCHRPIEDEGEGPYICCAGSTLRWRCTGCGKVSEGFALPYGLCPHCGGKLVATVPRPATESHAVEGVRMAYEIELGGRGFYQRAAAEAADPALRELFGRFAVMEGEHMETLERRYHVDVSASSPQMRLEVAAIFAGVEHRPAQPESLFEIAIALERRAAEFFAVHAAQADEDAALRQLFLELAAEEREHAEMLVTERARWRAGAGGLLGVQPRLASAAPAAATTNAAAVLLGDHDPQRPALVCDGQTLSYGELRERVARAAGALRARGVEPGERVAIKLPDGFDWLFNFLGAIWSGAVAVGVNPKIPASDWQYILDEAGFALIIGESADDTAPPWRERVVLPQAWRAEIDAAAPVTARAMAADAPAVWCHSAGTSGKPKAVIHGHGFAGEVERVSREGVGIRPGDRRRDRRAATARRAVLGAVAVPQHDPRGSGAADRRGRRAHLRFGRRGTAGELARGMAPSDRHGDRQRLRCIGDADPGDARTRRRGRVPAVARGRHRSFERRAGRLADAAADPRADARGRLPRPAAGSGRELSRWRVLPGGPVRAHRGRRLALRRPRGFDGQDPRSLGQPGRAGGKARGARSRRRRGGDGVRSRRGRRRRAGDVLRRCRSGGGGRDPARARRCAAAVPAPALVPPGRRAAAHRDRQAAAAQAAGAASCRRLRRCRRWSSPRRSAGCWSRRWRGRR